MPHFDEPTSTGKLSFQMAALSSYIKELKANFEKTIDGANEEMQEKIRDLQEKIKDAIMSLADAKQSASKSEDELKDIEDSINAITQALSLAEKTEEDPKTIEDMIKQRDEYKATREKVVNDYEEAQSNLEMIEEDVDEVRRNAYERVSNLVTEIYEFTSVKIKDAEAKQEEATSDLAKIEDEIKAEKESQTKTEDSIKESVEKYEVSKAEAEKSYEEQKAEFADKSDAMAEEHEAKIAELKKLLEGADEEKAAEIETKIAVLSKEYKAEVADFDLYKKETEDDFYTEQADFDKKHEAEKAEMKDEIKKAESKIEFAESSKEEIIVKSEEAGDEIKKFKKLCLDVLNPAYEWLNQEYEDFTNQIASLEKELSDFEERLDNTKAGISKAKDAVKTNVKESADATQQLADFKEKVGEKDTEHAEASKKFEAQMSELKAKAADENAPEELLAEIEAEMKDLQAQREEEVARLKKESSDLDNQIDYWTTKVDEYAKAIESANKTLHKLEYEEKEYSDTLDDIHNNISITKNAIESLQFPYDVVEKIYSEKYPSEEAFAHEGYFPLYKFEYNAAAASPNGSGTHSHTFDVKGEDGEKGEVTYYMPNGLNMGEGPGEQTGWHGDYGKKEEEPVKREPDLGQGVFLGNVVGLHGGGGNGAMFGDQLRESFSGTYVDMNLVTPNGGYEVGPDAYTWLPVVDKEAGETTTAVDVADKSVEAIRSAIISFPTLALGDAQAALNAEAPLEAVPVEEFENVQAFEKAEVEREVELDSGVTLIGYSDGAAMIPVVLKRLRDLGYTKALSRISRVVFIKGYVEGERHQGLAIPEEYTPFASDPMGQFKIKAYFIAGQNDDGFYQSTLDARALFNEPQSTITNGGHELEVTGLLSWARTVIPQPGTIAETVDDVPPSVILETMSTVSAYHNNDWNGRHGNDPAPPQADQEKWNAFLKSFLSPDEEGVVEMVEQMGGDPLYRINVRTADLSGNAKIDPMFADPMAIEGVTFAGDPMAIEGAELDPVAMEGDNLRLGDMFIYIGTVAEGTPIKGTVVQQLDIGMIGELATAAGFAGPAMMAGEEAFAYNVNAKTRPNGETDEVPMLEGAETTKIFAFMDAEGRATQVQFNSDEESPFMTKLLTTFFNAFNPSSESEKDPLREGERLADQILQKEIAAEIAIPAYVSIFNSDGAFAPVGFRNWILNNGAAKGLPISQVGPGVWDWNEDDVTLGEANPNTWFATAGPSWRIARDIRDGSLMIGVGINQDGASSLETEGRTISNIDFEKYDPIFTQLFIDFNNSMAG